LLRSEALIKGARKNVKNVVVMAGIVAGVHAQYSKNLSKRNAKNVPNMAINAPNQGSL
jgi:hypothetical protein